MARWRDRRREDDADRVGFTIPEESGPQIVEEVLRQGRAIARDRDLPEMRECIDLAAAWLARQRDGERVLRAELAAVDQGTASYTSVVTAIRRALGEGV